MVLIVGICAVRSSGTAAVHVKCPANALQAPDNQRKHPGASGTIVLFLSPFEYPKPSLASHAVSFVVAAVGAVLVPAFVGRVSPAAHSHRANVPSFGELTHGQGTEFGRLESVAELCSHLLTTSLPAHWKCADNGGLPPLLRLCGLAMLFFRLPLVLRLFKGQIS